MEYYKTEFIQYRRLLEETGQCWKNFHNNKPAFFPRTRVYYMWICVNVPGYCSPDKSIFWPVTTSPSTDIFSFTITRLPTQGEVQYDFLAQREGLRYQEYNESMINHSSNYNCSIELKNSRYFSDDQPLVYDDNSAIDLKSVSENPYFS